MLLSDAVAHGIDLRVHRPHPPGYPLLVETAALVHRTGVDPYRSLALVGTAGGVLAAAALAAFLAAAGLDADFACLGGLLYAVVPSVWLFGVRGFSDAPAAATVFASAALLLSAAERRSPARAAAGFAVAAAAAGLRPQSAVALVPLGIWAAVSCAKAGPRARALLLAGLGGAALLSAAVWLPAIRGSGGFAPFREQLLIQAADLRRSSALSAKDLLSLAVWRRWLVDPFGSNALFTVVGAAAAAGVLLRRRAASRILLLVLPWALVNVPVSTLYGAPRYAALLLGGVAGLAACGLAALASRAPRVGAAASTAFVAACAWVAVPPVVAAAAPSPSVSVVRAAAGPPYDRGTLVHDPELRMHVSRFLPGRAQSEIAPDRAVAAAEGDVVLTADRRVGGLAYERVFGRPDPLLARISLGFLLETRIGVAPKRLSVGTRPGGGDDEVVRYDASIPVAVDAPTDGAALKGTLDVGGWCQLRGGGAVEPVEFRLDGILARVLALERTPRPDVAAAIPEVGNASRAGYAARIDASGVAAGAHDLKVTFRATDGRRRIAPPVRFEWMP
ncbi:MAG: hypothetical protein IPP07_02515 [Holophagales bacterium]|nr:hypothetical protein [Holophagales bacterium]